MIKKIKRIIAGTLAAGLLTLGFMPAVVIAADIQNAACQGSKLEFPEGGTNVSDKECQFKENGETDPSSGVNDLITDVINIFSIIVGIVAVIMIIYGGFRYITSGGDSSKITDARNTILYAIVGLIIVAFAQFVVKFILSKISQ
ncbi:MAG TPA: pilin [Patescibacteria group bacterium]|nr:pilin [Patescibacteria group bacterium]